ncbi:hypothetical protein Lser_V15G34603 [Lactuca serriola]
MVTDGGSQMQENASVSGTSEDSCFAARPVPEQINECKQLINKVNSILQSLNIPISRYKTELNDLKFTFSSISDSLKRTRLSNSNLTDQLSRATSKGEERQKANVFPKVQTMPNQVFKAKGVTENQTVERKTIVDNENKDGCDDLFWSAPIDNANETVGLSERTSWKVKGRYMAEPLNNHSAFEKGSPSGTKEVRIESNPVKSEPEVTKASPKFDVEWYNNSDCSHHMTGRKEELQEFRALKDGGKVKYMNNSFGKIKGYDMITNGEFSKVAYLKGLHHNLISVSQLVVGTKLKVSFDGEGSEIIEKKSKTVLLKSQRNGEMYPLNLNPIRGKPAICLLTKAHSDESWLWHRRLSHLNFKDINKLVLGDHMRGLPLLKFDKDHLCVACEMGKQSRKSHPTIVNTKVIEPLELLHIDLCGPSAIKSVCGSKYILVIVDDFPISLRYSFSNRNLMQRQNSRISSRRLSFNCESWYFIFNSKEQRNKFDVKANEGIFLGYSLTSKAYKVLNKSSKKIEETYYVMFDDNYLKQIQSNESQIMEIFPKPCPSVIPISNLYEEFMLLFDEPEKAITSEAKAADNKVDELKKIIVDAVKD